MGYRSLIEGNVAKAFVLLKDLAEEVTLIKKTANSFDFSTQTATPTESNIVTKAVITDIKKSAENHNQAVKLLMLKTKEVGDISAFDKMTHKSQTWRIGPSIVTDSFVTVVEIHKEV